jgi:monoamine oxidase
MKRMNYSSITSAIRRIHEAKRRSDDSGIPVRELLEQDRELRRKLLQEREQQKQRRDFLKAAGGLGLGAAMMPFTQNAFAAPAGGSQPEIAIVGAGAGGLRTAHRLMQYGIGSKIYEAGDRVGGRMYSDNSFFSDNRVVEYGGEFISTEHTAVRNLAHQLNLQLEDVNKLSLGDEETYLVEGELYTEADLMDEWVGGLYDIMKRAQQDAPWQPMYNTLHTDKHIEYDYKDAIDWMTEIGYPSHHWVHKLLLADLIAEYGITVGNSALNLIYLLGWNTHNSGGLPLAGTDERLHVVGGNDLIMHGMADQLPAGSIEMEKKLVAIDGTIKAPGGPYTLHFDDRSSATCDVLVMALPMNLIKNIEIDPNISTAFGEKKQMAFDSTSTVSDNGKIMLEFSNRFWDRTQVIHGQPIHQAARAYSIAGEMEGAYSGFISTWEGEPGNPSPLGVMVNYNGGYEARNLISRNIHGVAHHKDVQRFLLQAEQIWGQDQDIASMYTGKALVSNWIDDPLARAAFTSPAVGVMTTWWGAQWETVEDIYFAGEAYDEEYWSYMNGAILSGERVAQEIQQNY